MGISLDELRDRLRELQRRDGLFRAYMSGDIDDFSGLKSSYPPRIETDAVEALLAYVGEEDVSVVFRALTGLGRGSSGSNPSPGLQNSSLLR